ncbi:MAG: hypothetical protein EZS28_016010 [Streblomastix strix]|uniref:Uncharacterized protein n=1 Tax=Streblomastix strix TaxID=222440 RepID=A0A5J4W0Z5_9EUKA|nr:MAG: hypothetical protein EZS28_016010 [Streblomastix strix]
MSYFAFTLEFLQELVHVEQVCAKQRNKIFLINWQTFERANIEKSQRALHKICVSIGAINRHATMSRLCKSCKILFMFLALAGRPVSKIVAAGLCIRSAAKCNLIVQSSCCVWSSRLSKVKFGMRSAL